MAAPKDEFARTGTAPGRKWWCWQSGANPSLQNSLF